MGMLDFTKKKFQKAVNNKAQLNENLQADKTYDERNELILEESIKSFFPETGHWWSSCFSKSNIIDYTYLPCHLRDNAWMSQLMQAKLYRKGIFIPLRTIKEFMNTSEDFANLRHEYELKIVNWQINYMMNGGEGWLMPKGSDELSLLFGGDVDRIFRAGIVKTLSAIGMNHDVIEEGIEKDSSLWRDSCMRKSFYHLYEPVVCLKGSPEPAKEEHMKNWLDDREYQYYWDHKDSVDKYGNLTPAMQMSKEEHSQLVEVLESQNAERLEFIEKWRNSPIKKHENPNTATFTGEHKVFKDDNILE